MSCARCSCRGQLLFCRPAGADERSRTAHQLKRSAVADDLRHDIVEQLERMILEGTLRAGERLPAERALAEQFGVSRPSLREAIQKLTAKGLLISRQGGGNYVVESLGSTFSDPLLHLLESSADAQRDLLEFRHTLEA
nr:hypothetical protein [Tanacetum cinerariifolium]